MIFQWIKTHRQEFPLKAMCKVLDVSRSGFNAWSQRPPCERRLRQEQLSAKIAQVHSESRGTYGSPRVYRELLAQGEKLSENTAAKLMRALGIRSRIKRRFVPRTTDSNHDLPIAENSLGRDFKASAPNKKWVADITYISTEEGWLYLAAVMDLHSRKIVGWSMSDHMRVDLVADALKMAILRRRPEKGLLHHSDRGVQYASGDYRDLLSLYGVQCSMSRKGNCYDNAAMESFWSTLKTEFVYREEFRSREESRKGIFEYIEIFYNRIRRHSSLGYVSPEAFEAARN